MIKYLFGNKKPDVDADNKELYTDVNHPIKKEDVVVIIKPRGQDINYDLDEKASKTRISTVFESEDIFKYHVYPKIVDIYFKNYNNVYWVVQSDNPELTVDELVEAGVTKNIYHGDVGLAAILTQLTKE